ncbi:DUF4982 domain-containing protein [Rathayibacter festucae]|uniref:DUF4982 domain-containing protein n=1 Tax=Rathayibacter festucae TaxID=110937 RepID=UPI002A6A7210|nr:DUF4982 domain-containing protein [Rathayibacter festucae]MDY0914552.1 DUF4982 domain-containing protein [Rathayibacter festucae]
MLAWSGDIDVTGRRRPASYYREIVFGLRHEPYIAVRRPENYHREAVPGVWSWSDAVSSWDWNADAGSPIVVEVYSDADEVELLINGRSRGREPAGAAHRFRAEFDTAYERGQIMVIAYENGAESGRTLLRSPEGAVRLSLEADRDEIHDTVSDLSYVDLEFRDAFGTPVTSQDRPITVRIQGPGQLQGFASGRPATEESFASDTQTTFDGHALAVIRPTGPGVITVIAEAEDGLRATVNVTVAAS